jgi:hypothetical protein
MPEWLVSFITKDAPTFGILLGAGWMLFGHMAKQHKDHLASLDAKQKAELDRLVEVFTKAIADKEIEISRLVEEKDVIQKDRDGFYKDWKSERRVEQAKS